MDTPLFGILISLIAYIIGAFLAKKINNPLLNKFMIAITFVMLVIVLFDIEYSTYQIGGDFILFFLPIVVVTLAIPLYKNQNTILKYKWIFLLCLLFGIAFNMMMVYFVLKIFDLPYALSVAMYTKSITTPMAVSVHDILKADGNIAVLLVTVASFVAGIFGKLIIKITKTKNEFSKGMALGLFSHVIGSIVALEESDEAGAIAITTLTLAGVITVLVLPLIIDLLI